MNHMKIETNTMSFRIDIDFDGSDVDMVYNEIKSRGSSNGILSFLVDIESKGYFGTKPKPFKLKGNKTPTEDSVNFCLQWLSGYVDRNQMCIVTGKWTDYTAKRKTLKFPDGTEYTGCDYHITELE